jgi:hypothetical protein
VLKNRDTENKNFVLFSSYVCIYIITKVLFIWHKKRSEKTNVIKLHSLVGVIGQRRSMDGHPLSPYYS